MAKTSAAGGGTPTVTTGSAYQLLGVRYEQHEAAAYERRRVRTACPNDGQPLQAGPNGELHCAFDGWIWDGNP